MTRIALATCADRPAEFDDDELLLDALRRLGAQARWANWHDDGEDWERFDRVVVRSPWDYTMRHAEFLVWCERVGPRLRNTPALISWNSDKRYLADLAADGLSTVDTRYVAPGDAPPVEMAGEVVVKPTVSAGARDTGRFGPDAHDQARELVASINATGRTAMVQPYLPSVADAGEIAVVMVAGEPCHALRKGAILGGGVAPVRSDGVGAAEAMFDPDLVRAARADAAQLALARATLTRVAERFGATPLFARVDMLDDDGTPVLLELEAIEPCLYLREAPETARTLAEAILAED